MLDRARPGTAPEGAAARFFAAIDRHPVPLVVAVVALNLVLKLRFVGRPSLWLDEAVTIFYGQQSWHEIVRFSAHDQNPPLYYLLAGAWIRLLGDSEAAVRSLSALLSAATGGAIAVFARRFLDVRAAIVASLLFATSRVHLLYAQEARTYALVSLLVVVSFHLFLALFDRRPERRPTGSPKLIAAALTMVNTLLLYAHYLTVWALGVQILVACLLARRAAKPFRLFLLSQLGVAVLLFPWLRFAIANIPAPGAFWLAPPAWIDLVRLAKQLAGSWQLLLVDLALIVAAVVLALLGRRVDRPALEPAVLALLVAWSFLPIAADFAVAAFTPIFLARYLLYCSIGEMLLVSYLISTAPVDDTVRCAVALPAVLFAATQLDLHPPKPHDWRAAVAAVREERTPGSLVVLSPGWQSTPFAYYFDLAAFRDHAATIRRLSAARVLPAELADDVDPRALEPIDRLILVRELNSRLDARRLVERLGSRDDDLTVERSFAGIEVRVYRLRSPPAESAAVSP